MNANTKYLPSSEQLEAMKSRFSHLVHSLSALLAELKVERAGAPLPDWPSLHAQFSVLQQQLASLSTALAIHQEALIHTVAYPLPHFPVRTQESFLSALLRKKLTPEVEKWVSEGFKIGNEIESRIDTTGLRETVPLTQRPLPLASFSEGYGGGKMKKKSDMMDEEEDDDAPRELNWALKIVVGEVRARDWEAEYTLEEMSSGGGGGGGDTTVPSWRSVETGLLVDSEGRAVRKPVVDDEEEKKKKVVEKPKVRERPAGPRPRIHIPEKHMVVDPETGGLRLETLFRFLSSGIHPAALMHPEEANLG